MVDGALETLDVALFSRGMDYVVTAFSVANGSGVVSRPRTRFPIFSNFSRYTGFCSILFHFVRGVPNEIPALVDKVLI